MESKAYVINIENFVGPLELLDYLIKKNKLQINQISLGKVTADYLKKIKSQEIDCENLAYFLEVASSLVLIKSLSLVPQVKENIEKEDEEKIFELEQKLKVYSIFKKYFLFFEKKYFKKKYHFQVENFEKIKVKEACKLDISKKDLFLQMKNLIRKLNKTNVLKRKAIGDRIKIAKIMQEIDKKIEKLNKIDLLYELKNKTKDEKVLIFLAILELARLFKIKVKQNNFLSNILIEKAK